MAAPTPTPAKPCSVIGVSTTRRGAEFLQQALRDLVGALILGDLLAHDEDVLVAAHLLGHGVAQRFAHRGRHHLGAGRNVGVGDGLGVRGSRNLGRFLLALGSSEASRALPPASSAAALVRRPWRAAQPWRRRIGSALAFLQQDGDRRVDLDALGAGGDQDLAQNALVDGFDFHGRLVGLDFGDDVAGDDLVALVLQPLGEIALLHRRRKRGHQNFDRHVSPSLSA